jgi:hypothetical protein
MEGIPGLLPTIIECEKRLSYKKKAFFIWLISGAREAGIKLIRLLQKPGRLSRQALQHILIRLDRSYFRKVFNFLLPSYIYDERKAKKLHYRLYFSQICPNKFKKIL